MWRKLRNNPTVKGIIYFFPLQLLMLHFQRNQILLLFWIIITGFITQRFATDFGVPYLFLYPEYMGDVSVWSYAIIGFSFGGFVMAFNISSYIINSFRFPFLATLQRPFMKYCLNNFIIPSLALCIYIVQMVRFLHYSEFLPTGKILIFLGAFFAGMSIFILISLGYFFTFAKDFIRMFGIHPDEHSKQLRKARKARRAQLQMNTPTSGTLKIKRYQYNDEWAIETYLRNPFRISRARSAGHYDRSMLMKVFQQNHISAAIFEIVVFASLILLGLFREIPFFKIPAGASILLLGTMLLMLASAVHFILRRWSTLFFIITFMVINFMSRYPAFNVTNYAYGLDYNHPVEYDPYGMQEKLLRENPMDDDRQLHEEILYRWKKKVNGRKGPQHKPKLVIINCSGGGLKSALWTFHCLQYTDSVLGGQLMKQTHLITGSSGGMIGAAYYRELYLQKQLGIIDELWQQQWAEKVSTDILNPVATTIALNDLFIRLQTFSEGTYRYPKDRAYAFEKQLNENTDYVLDKRLADYTPYEEQSTIPLMILSPTIVNDGKRLLISPLPISFMSNNLPVPGCRNEPIIEDLEFTRLLEGQQPMNLKFTSAIRMNATFPYILPTVSLPTSPAVEIMDAGLRDNYGTRTGIKYIYHLRQWINENTSGVVIMRIHDSKRETYNKKYVRSFFDNLFSPLGGLLNNLSRIQMQENDNLIQVTSAYMDVPINVVEFKLGDIITKKEISMSLHLTTREKQDIRNALQHYKIGESVQTMKKLLEP